MNVNKININQSEPIYYIETSAYDVSAHNNGVTFESLSVLLSDSNLSTLIPSEVRCGGMSIRFVQSSDNKYVQYRLMATSFSTTERDWQGVDAEPVEGSRNLVESGGVAEGFKKPISAMNGTSIEYHEGFISAVTGKYNDNPSYNYSCVQANQGDIFLVKGYTGGGTQAKELFLIPSDGSSVIVADYTPGKSNTYTYEYTVPKDGLVVANTYTQYDHNLIYYPVYNRRTDENAVKLLKLVSFKKFPQNPVVGQYYYADSKRIYKITEVNDGIVSKYDIIPFYDGAIYTYNGNTYTWNGSDLVKTDYLFVDKNIKKGDTEKSPSVDVVATMVNGYTLELLDSWEAGFIRTNSDSVDTSIVEQPTKYRHLLIPCVSGDNFVISGKGAAGARLWCFIDTNNSPLTRASGAITADCLSIEAPENAVYLIINDNNTDSTCYKGKTISDKITEIDEKQEVVVLTNINSVPSYPSNLQVGDCFYISGNSYRKVTTVREDGFPSGYDSIPLSKDVIYRCNNSLYYYDGTTLQKFNDEQPQEHRLKMSAVMLNIANPTPSNEDVVYPVLWGVKYNNSKNVTNGYGNKAHAIPVGWLYYDKNNMNDIYYSFGVADKMTKILTWNSVIADGYTPMHYQPIICKNGDIVCVPRAENYPSSDSPQTRTKNPIVYKNGDYDNPIVVNVSDSVYGIKPVSWFSNSGVCFIDDENCFVFGEYTRPDFEPANVWKVSYPFDTPSNWNIVLHTTGTGEGTRDVEHFHCVNLDPFTDMIYAASGDSATESKIWESDDFGSTWVLKFDSGGDENKRKLARMLNWIFTKEAAYYGSDQSPYINRINRGDNGKIDFDTIASIGQLSANSSNVYVGQTYYTCLIDEPFGLLLLQQRGDTSGKDNAVFFYSLERKFKVGEVVRWEYSDNGTIVKKIGTIESTTDGESGTIFLGLGVTATFGKGLTTSANSVETSRLCYDSRCPEFYIHKIMVLPPVDIPRKYPNGFRCEAVNVYQSRAEKRIICGFGLAPNRNEMAGNKNPSEINNLALEVY